VGVAAPHAKATGVVGNTTHGPAGESPSRPGTAPATPRAAEAGETVDACPRASVSFDSAGRTIAGHLYTPDGQPGSGVKEQAAGHYASRLARQGFTTLAFDAAHQGESEGLRAASRARRSASRTSRPPCSHVDLYDKEQYVAPAVERLTALFTTSINA
jgi:hypothetical protein